MRSIAKAIVVGNVGSIKLINTISPTAQKCYRVRIATNWRDKSNNQYTDWHTVLFYGSLADTIEKYLKVGDRLYVEGRLRSRTYKDQNDKNITVWEIIVQDFMFLTPKQEPATQPEIEEIAPPPPDTEIQNPEESVPDVENDMPF